jgi:protein FRG1
MVKPLTFKGDKKTKKRKRIDTEEKFGADKGDSLVSSELGATKQEAEVVEDDSWVVAEAVEDVVGPIILILPSDKPTCLACDTNGTVFLSLLENIIENDPATSEPHDVRQVWVASRVAGTETFNFKGHHGRYVDLATIHTAG